MPGLPVHAIIDHMRPLVDLPFQGTSPGSIIVRKMVMALSEIGIFSTNTCPISCDVHRNHETNLVYKYTI